MAHGFTDKDGDYFEASRIGEGMMRLRAVYGAKTAERVDVDVLATDVDSVIRILQLAADDKAAKPINSVRDLVGIAPDWTDGMSSVDWVRAQRDRA